MSVKKDEFTRLVEDAWSHEISGWDWRYLEGRLSEETVPWQYPEMARERIQHARSLLEIGTGGGELFSSLGPFPQRTIAIEAYPPSVGLAGARLHPLAVQVIHSEGDVQRALPFAGDSFDLAVNRHAGYSPVELYRVLFPGGRFLTQQVGGRNQFRLNQLFQTEPTFIYQYWTLDYAVKELRAAGFHILDAQEAFPQARFYDIGAVVFFLKIIDWQVAGFNPLQYHEELRRVHQLIQDDGCLLTFEHRFIIEAQKRLFRNFRGGCLSYGKSQ
jgi:SAM-dependent methyltransferase